MSKELEALECTVVDLVPAAKEHNKEDIEIIKSALERKERLEQYVIKLFKEDNKKCKKISKLCEILSKLICINGDCYNIKSDAKLSEKDLKFLKKMLK